MVKINKNSLLSVQKQLAASIEVKRRLLARPAVLRRIVSMADTAVDVFRAGGRLLIAGNGGSAADAQHIAGELVGRFMRERSALSALALTTDTSIITAWGNDYSFEAIFARQVEAQGRRGDMFLGLSTSGNSANIVAALQAARKIGLRTAGITGLGGGKMAALCDICVCVPARETPRVQECQLAIEHIFCGLVEECLFGSSEVI